MKSHTPDEGRRTTIGGLSKPLHLVEMLWQRLLEHVLIWVAASAAIVLGLSGTYAFGRVRPLGLMVATLACVFAAALVQRSPAAVVALVVFSAGLFVFGSWLVVGGARTVGLTYIGIGTTYIVGLGPSSLRWLGGERRMKN